MGAIRELGLAVALGAAGGCNYYDFDAPLEGDSDGAGDGCPRDPFFDEEEWARVCEHSPLLDPPPDPTNVYADDPDAAVLGQMLYFERDYAGSRTPLWANDDGENCAGCHDPERWFQGNTTIPDGWRNTPSVVNAVSYRWFLWDGGRDSMWAQSLGPPEAQLSSSRLRVAHVIFEQYRGEYDAIFDPDLPPALDPSHPEAGRFPPDGFPNPDDPDDPWWSMDPADQHVVNRIFANFGKAVAAYQRKLVSRNAPFDRYAAGERDAIDETAKRGLRLFVGDAHCARCHRGPAFTDNEFHNIGVPLSDGFAGRFEAIPFVIADKFNTASPYSDHDIGLLDDLVATAADMGRFRTKHLRQIAETGRYMHAGQLADLRSVVEFYNEPPAAAPVGMLDEHIEPLGLTPGEIDDVVAFLSTLTGEPIPPELRADTSR